jgi:hypothetical protein
MKKFITVLLREVGLRSLLVRYHKSRLLSALADMKRFGTETSMPTWCSQRFQRHHDALRRLGFVEQREFVLQQRAISGPESFASKATSLQQKRDEMLSRRPNITVSDEIRQGGFAYRLRARFVSPIEQ